MNIRAINQLPPELPALWYEIPAHYRTSCTVVIGPDDPILWPADTEQLDYELEVAVCLGRRGVDVPEEKAAEYIFGYTIYNDISARDIQGKEMALMLGPGKGKSFENSNIMGPLIVEDWARRMFHIKTNIRRKEDQHEDGSHFKKGEGVIQSKRLHENHWNSLRDSGRGYLGAFSLCRGGGTGDPNWY